MRQATFRKRHCEEEKIKNKPRVFLYLLFPRPFIPGDLNGEFRGGVLLSSVYLFFPLARQLWREETDDDGGTCLAEQGNAVFHFSKLNPLPKTFV